MSTAEMIEMIQCQACDFPSLEKFGNITVIELNITNTFMLGLVLVCYIEEDPVNTSLLRVFTFISLTASGMCRTLGRQE